ncbi:N-terminal half of MaoC dehydratase [Polaromonas sp. OV174]|uniref:MaoC/PaaZ C-terminal domain-containing protein n=1 Tax=Polaromonas sp. OV174 TaxID=1855300 RepID=UPI0008E7FF56|nr:MaoC/PaaZ C-terminal domain-containing protein [Polaromonas sp. OV174]SFB89354.1 N-terminal half of MaoC dehydratase [Polaromonas sp. OV174]
MTPSPLHLLDWQVPVTTHRYTRRDTAFYALSLGLGRDPLDRRQLALVDPWHPGLKALPSLALVLGYPGFWLGELVVHEATGIAPWQVLHVEQSVHLAGPLPPEGQIVGKTSVTALVDKGADRGSFLYSERQVIDQASGALLATCRQVHFLRKAGGCGSAGKPPPQRPPVSMAASSLQVDIPCLPQQALVYRLNGDSNPLHSDPEVAARAGFPKPILHGMCTAGMAVAAVIDALADADPGRSHGFTVRMTNPVLPGDTLRVEMWPDGSFRARALERDVLVLDAGHVQLQGV